MTPSTAVAHDTRAVLATLDPALPALADVLDARAAAALLAHVTRGPSCAAGPLGPFELRRSGVTYRPGHSCVVTWEQQGGPDPTGRRSTVDVLVLEAHPDGVRSRRFVPDAALPGLRDAADGAAVRPRLSALLGRDVLESRVTPVRYRSGSRCVLRYDVRTADGARVLYGKVLRGDVRALANRLSALAARTVDDASLPALAPVLGAVPELGLVVQAEAGGRPLEVGRGQEDGATWRAAGRQLAALHRIPAAGLLVRRPADDLADVRDCLPAVLQAASRPGARLAHGLDRLAEHLPGPCACTTHGALRTDQVRLDGGRLVLLDLDDLCAAPGERDLANLLAYLRWRALRRPALATHLAGARATLVDGYLDGGGPLDGAALGWYERLSLLKIAARRYRRLDVDEWELVPRLLDEADALATPRSRSARTPLARRPAELVLTPALDPAAMTVHLAPLLAPWAAPGARPEVLAARVLATKPGVRAVVRYDVAGLSLCGAEGEDAPHSGTAVVLGKLYREPERAARLDRTLRLLGVLAGPRRDDRARPGSPRVPPGPGGGQATPFPLGRLDAPPLAVYVPAPGDRLDELPADLATAVCADVGRWLAGLHGAAVRFERRVDERTEVRDAGVWASVVAAASPHDGPAARQLAAQLARCSSGAPPAVLVPLHRDLHQGHLLAGRRAGVRHLSVIDLDEARMGDPCVDVAHLCANLDLLRESGRPEAAQWRARFLDEYARRAGWRPGPAVRFWYAHTCLKMAKQLVTGRGPWPELAEAERHRLVPWVLAAGREELR